MEQLDMMVDELDSENTLLNSFSMDEDKIDENIDKGLQFILQQTSEYTNIIKSAKTEIKKKIFRKKIKKLQKELQMLLYLQHMRNKRKEAVENTADVISQSE